MRRRQWMLAVPMMLLCLLCACGGKENDPIQAAMDFRAALLARGGCRFTLAAQAESGGELWALDLDCQLEASGDGSVTVLAPESIAGIRAESRDGAESLVYEDVCLGLGTLPDSALAPAAIPGRLVRAWAQDWIASTGAEEGGLLVCCEDGELEFRTWLDEEGLPRRMELALRGRSCFNAEIKNFEWKVEGTHETTEENLG